jgi:hypothetical protein
MTTAITGGTITWGALELKNQFVAKGIDPTMAGFLDVFIQWFTGTEAYSTLDRNAGLILALSNIARPLVEVARACWKVYGVAGTTAATVANIVSFISTIPSWQFDSNIKVYRPDLAGVSTILGTIIHSFLGDAAAADYSCAIGSLNSGILVSSKLYDDDVNSSTYGTEVVLTQDQYARAVYSMMRKLIKIMRYFATGSVQYPQYLSNNYPAMNIGPLLDDTKGAGSSEIG